MDSEVWGTFSVSDHLRRRAFVADVLLYDELVVPVPPEGDEAEERRWVKEHWQPKRQQKLLDLIDQSGGPRVLRIPWNSFFRDTWEKEYRENKKAARPKKDFQKTEIAHWATVDMESINRAFNDLKESGRAVDRTATGEIAQYCTRMVLAKGANKEYETDLLLGLPKVEAIAVAAYGSYASFARNVKIAPPGNVPSKAVSLVDVFGAEFLVPDNPERTDIDLLKESLELACMDEIKEYRRAFHFWRRDNVLRGKTPQEAREIMEDLIARYQGAVKKKNLLTRTKYAFAIGTAGSAVAAVSFPPAGILSAVIGLGSFVITTLEDKPMPEGLKAAAMFYSARKHFGWYG